MLFRSDLRQRFGMAQQPPSDETRIVVANLHGRTIGFVVDGVSEVLRLQRDEIAPTPATLQAAGKDYIQGLARRGTRLLILLDMERLLGSAQELTGMDTNANQPNGTQKP